MLKKNCSIFLLVILAMLFVSSCGAGKKMVAPRIPIDLSKIRSLQEQCRYDHLVTPEVIKADSLIALLTMPASDINQKDTMLIINAAEACYNLALVKNEAKLATVKIERLKKELTESRKQNNTCNEQLIIYAKQLATYKELLIQIENVKNR